MEAEVFRGLPHPGQTGCSSHTTFAMHVSQKRKPTLRQPGQTGGNTNCTRARHILRADSPVVSLSPTPAKLPCLRKVQFGVTPESTRASRKQQKGCLLQERDILSEPLYCAVNLWAQQR